MRETSFTISNPDGLKLHCTYIRQQLKQPRPVLVYLHGNGGNKFEGEEWLGDLCMVRGLNLFTFDFSTCGNGEAKWVTMGYKEKDDLKAVVVWLEK